MLGDIAEMLEFAQTRLLDGQGEIPDDRLHWKPTPASTSPAETVRHTANAERRVAAFLRGEDPNALDAEAGSRAWIEAAGSGTANTHAVPRDRSGLSGWA